MKHIHRFFANESLSSGQAFCLSSDDTFHAEKVLRLHPGDQLELADTDGRAFQAEVTQVGGLVEVKVCDEVLMPSAIAPMLTVVQSMPKGRKMDLVVEKLSELGVAVVVPAYSDYSVAKPKPGGGSKAERWRRIALSSARQAKRAMVMEVAEPIALAGWLDCWDGALIVLATEIDAVPLGSAVERTASPLALMVGPEAGFSAGEIGMLQAHGAIFASLGNRVLRTETAALVATTVVMHRLGALG